MTSGAGRDTALLVGGLAAAVAAVVVLPRVFGTQAAEAGALTLAAASGFAGSAGKPVTATLTFADTGGTGTPAQTVQVAVTVEFGASTTQLGASAAVPALSPQGSQQVQMTTTGPLPASASGVATVEVEALGQTITGTLVVAQPAATPASFGFAESSLGTLNVSPGDVVQVALTVQNNGGTAGIPNVTGAITIASFTGGSIAAGTQEGTLALTAAAPSIPAGGSAGVTLTSGAISSDFAGYSLGISATVTP